MVKIILNCYPNYPTHRLYFGEVETPYGVLPNSVMRAILRIESKILFEERVSILLLYNFQTDILRYFMMKTVAI